MVDLFALLGALHGMLADLLHKLPAVGHCLATRYLRVTNTHSGLKACNMK